MSLTALVFLILASIAGGLMWLVCEGRTPTWVALALSLFVFGLVGALLPALIGG